MRWIVDGGVLFIVGVMLEECCRFVGGAVGVCWRGVGVLGFAEML